MSVTPKLIEDRFAICSLADSCDIIAKLTGSGPTFGCYHSTYHRPDSDICIVKGLCPHIQEDVVCD